MSAKVFKSVVHNDALPKRVNDFLPVKAKKSTPAEKASPRFVDVYEHARNQFAKKLEKKFNTASANRRLVLQSILTRKKPTVKSQG